jgi:hypothetical protein
VASFFLPNQKNKKKVLQSTELSQTEFCGFEQIHEEELTHGAKPTQELSRLLSRADLRAKSSTEPSRPIDTDRGFDTE